MTKLLLFSFAGILMSISLTAIPSHADALSDFTFERWCTEIAQKDAATCAKHTDADVAEYRRVHAAMSRMEQEDKMEKCRESSKPGAMANCGKRNYEIDPNSPATADPFGLKPR